jgi:hypothetical protein
MLMNYALEIGSVAMIYIPSFTKAGAATQKLVRAIHRQQTTW